MTEEYVKYWGLTQHPFLLAPDGRMMCVTGQYFECFERLKYAISTNKGGVIIASEDAGLGKTTILLKLIDELRDEHGDNFRYAYVDHPTLTASQMIEQITGAVTGQTPSEDKLKNLLMLRETLIETKKEGGKNIIVIDEGQMLCEAKDVLQELRALINLTHNGEYLHTFILSGQKALWDTLQEIPEFWQRLPVRYYFTPLRFEETRELIRYRLNRAGLDVAREIFTDEALEIIHKYSQGLPRTIIAVADLGLLNGFTDRTRKVGFKEVSKAINAMSGKGESLSYVTHDRTDEARETPVRTATDMRKPAQTTIKPLGRVADTIREGLVASAVGARIKPAFVVAIIALFIFLGAMGHKLFSSGNRTAAPAVSVAQPDKAKADPVKTALPETGSQQGAQADKAGVLEGETPADRVQGDTTDARDLITAYKEERKARKERSIIVERDAANIRSAPSLEAQRIVTIVKGEMLTVVDEKTDAAGMKWYKVLLYNNREGWIAARVATLAAR